MAMQASPQTHRLPTPQSTHLLLTPFLYVCWMYFMPDTISLFTCGDTEQGSAGFPVLLLCPSLLDLTKPLPYPERDFYPVLHTFLQHK